MCKTLKVSPNGYYSWLRGGGRQEDPMLAPLVKSTFDESMQTYGTRRIKRFFEKEYGWVVSRRRIAKTMKALNLKVKSKKRFRVATTDSKHNLAISPNRLRQDFCTYRPNEVYVGDITYIRTQQGWIYLATVIDLFSRSVVGYAIDDRLHTRIIVNALGIARSKRASLYGAIFHSDRGSQYASDEFREHLGRYGMIQSMSAKGNCYDNAVAESFFHTLKTELIHHMRFQTKEEAKRAISGYINFYNTKRLHSYNDYISPIEAEIRWWLNENSRAA
jgi:transposase InsO family protein